jgi:NAD(P)H-dependent FMN reductase
MDDLKLGVILASTREGRRGEGFARWVHGLLSQCQGVQTELIDLRDWRLPSYDHPVMQNVAERSYADPLARGWLEKIGPRAITSGRPTAMATWC